MDIRYGSRIICLSNRIKRESQKLECVQSLSRVSGQNGFILVYINEHSDRAIYQKDIEAHFGITRSTASKVITLMEKKGLIQRVSTESDARLKQLVLTKEAKKIVMDVEEGLNQFDIKLVESLSDEEKEQLLFLIKKMERNISL